jgi:hypothetical protein
MNDALERARLAYERAGRAASSLCGGASLGYATVTELAARHGSGDLRDFAENTETARILSFNKQKKTAPKK